MKLGKLPIIETIFAITLVLLNVIGYFISKNSFLLILVSSVIFIILFAGLKFSEKKRREIAVEEVTFYVDKHGEDLFSEFPVGVMSINASGIIRWVNKFIELQYEESVEMRSVEDIFPGALTKLNDESREEPVLEEINGSTYELILRNGGIYFFDVTKCMEIKEKFHNNKQVFGVINLDNYDDYMGSLDDQRANDINLHMTKLINNWCSKHKMYIRRYNSNRFLLFTREETLCEIISEGFVILDQIREYGTRCKLPLTLSMSFARDIEDVNNLAETAYEGLDLVLSRGGDQVVVKNKGEKSEFYGGKTEAFQKNNRAKARMFASSVANLSRNSKNIVIMGHSNPDFDSIGACVGMSKIAKIYNDNVKVILDFDSVNDSSRKLINELKGTEFFKNVVTSNAALELIEKETLLIVVDTHKSSLVASKEALDKARNVIVIDHHRRGDDFIDDPIVAYVEPYASSTSELITELFGFQIEKVEIGAQEATAMLSGIIMDTKNFVYRTGNRTFDAASKLKSLGADTILIQDLLKEELDKVVLKNEMISKIDLINERLAVTYLTENRVVNSELLAQTADEIMEIEGILASFVVGYTGKNVYLSARSLGEVNVQVVAEKFGGGGHLTGAATQITDKSVEEFVKSLKEYLKGVELYEGNFSS